MTVWMGDGSHEISIYADGRAELTWWEGTGVLRLPGCLTLLWMRLVKGGWQPPMVQKKIERKMSPEQIAAIIRKLDDADFFSMRKVYHAPVMDGWMDSLSVAYQGRSGTVMRGNRIASEAYADAIQFIEDFFPARFRHRRVAPRTDDY